MKKHIYLAGSLFSEAEVAQRLKEGKIIKETFGDKYTLYNPIEAPCNDKEANLPSCIDIFTADTEEVLNSDIVIADLANQDPGVMMELGIAWGLDYAAQILETMGMSEGQKEFLNHCGIKRKDVQAVLSDIRLSTAHLYKGEHIPYGYNQFVVGGIIEMDGKIHKSFDDLIKDMEDSANE